MQVKPLTKKQEAKVNSFRATEAHVDANLSIIAVFAAFVATFNKIKANIAQIIDYAGQKTASIAGYAEGKGGVRENLCRLAAAIAGLVYSYADDTGNVVLRSEMDFNYTKIKRTRDDELAPVCQLIHDRAVAVPTETLKDYNLNAAKLTEFQALIDQYKAEAPKPRVAVSTRKTTGLNINNIIKETDSLYEKLDRQIESLRTDHPDFVVTYFSTREIIDSASKPKPPNDAVGNK
jgi:hypothetical protein